MARTGPWPGSPVLTTFSVSIELHHLDAVVDLVRG
jgi:hypothetical protein